MTVSRRYLFHRVFALASTAGVALTSAAEAQTKASQKLVAYQNTPKEGHSCATCTYFEPPNTCKVVDGTISPAGWCSLWSQKT